MAMLRSYCMAVVQGNPSVSGKHLRAMSPQCQTRQPDGKEDCFMPRLHGPCFTIGLLIKTYRRHCHQGSRFNNLGLHDDVDPAVHPILPGI